MIDLSLKFKVNLVSACLLACFFLFSNILIGQQNIQILDESDSSKIAFATLFKNSQVIGYYEKNDITLFSAGKPKSAQLWSLGYDTVTVKFPLEKNQIIWLNRKEYQLKEISIVANNCLDTIFTGSEKGNLQRKVGTRLEYLSQVSRRFKISDYPSCKLLGVKFFMPKSREKISGKVRLRIYKQRSDTSLPGNDLLHNSYVKEVVNDGLWYEILLGKEIFYPNENVFVAIEVLSSSRDYLKFGVIAQKHHASQSYTYVPRYNYWHHFSVGKDVKRKPNYAISLSLACPCR